MDTIQTAVKPHLVLVHKGCTDGTGAAWAATKWLDIPEIIACDYGDTEVPDVEGRDVYIFDFSFPRDVLEAMHAKAKSLALVDHHKTAMDNLQGLDYVHLDMGKSGAVLAWEFLAAKHAKPGDDVEVPEILLYIQDRDIWKWQMPDSRAYCEALRAELPLSLTLEEQIERLGRVHNLKTRTEMVEVGTLLLAAKEEQIKSALDRRMWVPFTVDAVDYSIPMCFANANLASDLGNQLSELEGNRSCCGIVVSGLGFGKFGLSVRGVGKDNDLPRRLAQSLGGGGHNLAAGCGLEPFDFAQLIAKATRPEWDLPKEEPKA